MYLGGFVNEEDAARAYDLAALACKGRSVPTNFAPSDYDDNLSEISGSSRVPCSLHLHQLHVVEMTFQDVDRPQDKAKCAGEKGTCRVELCLRRLLCLLCLHH